MKKFKWTLMACAIVLSLSGAFANRPLFDCSNDIQYFLSGGTYHLAGTEGITYTCILGTGTCTYYTDDGENYFPCQSGTYCTSNCFRQAGKPH